MRHDHIHIHAALTRVGHLQHRHAHSGTRQDIQPGTGRHDQETSAYHMAVAPQDELQRTMFQLLAQGRSAIVRGALVGVLNQTDLAVGPIQVQLDSSCGLGFRIDDFSGFKLNAVRNLDSHLMR